MSIFPFTLPYRLGRDLFDAFYRVRKDDIDAKYGEQVITTIDGKTGTYKLFHHDGSVSVRALSPTCIDILTSTRGEAISFKGIRVGVEVLADAIEAQKRHLATVELHRRRQLAEQAAVDAIYKELFK